MSELNKINEIQKRNKIKNLISFGNNSQGSKNNESILENSLTVRCEDSFSFDLDKQLRGLGLEVICTEENKMLASLDLRAYYCIKRQKFHEFVTLLSFNLTKIKQQINCLRQNALQLQQFSLLESYWAEIKQKKNKAHHPSNDYTNFEEESLVISAGDSRQMNKKQKLLLQSTVFSLHFKKDEGICRENSRGRSFTKQENYLYQIKKIKQQNQIRQNQIDLLKIQIIGLKKLNQNKQHHFNEKLEIKQSQWQQKLNQIIGQLSNSNKKQYSQEYQHDNSREFTQIRKRAFTESCEPYSCRGRINTDHADEQLETNITLKDSRQDLRIKILRSPKNRTERNQPPQLKIFFDHSDNIQQKFQDRLRLSKQRERKKSTDFSYERVTQKIKNFQSSIRKQMGKYQY